VYAPETAAGSVLVSRPEIVGPGEVEAAPVDGEFGDEELGGAETPLVGLPDASMTGCVADDICVVGLSLGSFQLFFLATYSIKGGQNTMSAMARSMKGSTFLKSMSGSSGEWGVVS